MTQYEVTAAGVYHAANPVQAARWFAEEAANGQPFSYLDVRDQQAGGRYVVDLASGTLQAADNLQTIVAMPRPTMDGIEIPETVKSDQVLDALVGMPQELKEHMIWECYERMAALGLPLPIVKGRLLTIGEEQLGDLWTEGGAMVTEDDFGTVAFVATDRENAIIADAAISAGAHDIRVTMDRASFTDGTELADYIAHNAKLAQGAALQFLAESSRQLRQYAKASDGSADNPAVVLTQNQFNLLLVIADAYFDNESTATAEDRVNLALCETSIDDCIALAATVREALRLENYSQATYREEHANGQH